jgi:hypothetical protein
MADLISGIKIPDSKIAAKQRDWFVNMRRENVQPLGSCLAPYDRRLAHFVRRVFLASQMQGDQSRRAIVSLP